MYWILVALALLPGQRIGYAFDPTLFPTEQRCEEVRDILVKDKYSRLFPEERILSVESYCLPISRRKPDTLSRPPKPAVPSRPSRTL